MKGKINKLNVDKFKLNQNSKKHIEKFLGPLDGNASKRIVNFLIENG